MSSAGRERSALHDALRDQRRHVLGILDGLDDPALGRAVLPSGWTCLGLVQHLALDVELFWFRAVMAGEPAAIEALDGPPENAWLVEPSRSAADVLDRYREECALADAVIEGTPLDAAPAWWPQDRFGDWRIDDLRQVVLHVIAETACHAGHLDAARELIDGRQWIVLTE